MRLRSDTRRGELLAAAVGYANRGWHVFPLRPGSKKPAVPNHPAHLCDRADPRCRDGHVGWEQRATLDVGRIERAWSARPYGIGIATGPSQLVVIDLDVPTDPDHLTGRQRLAQLEHRTGESLPETRTVTTPSGGRHLYFRQPPGGPVLTNTASRLGPYIDTRATGGYVVAPPTRLGPDLAYDRITDAQPLPIVPGWIVALLQPQRSPVRGSVRPVPSSDRRPVVGSDRVRRYVEVAVADETTRITGAAPGTRNNALFAGAIALGQLVGAEILTPDDAHHSLWSAASHHVAAGAYTARDAERTIASGLTRGQTEPRRLPTDLTTAGVRR